MSDIDYIRRYLSDVPIEITNDIPQSYIVEDSEYLEYLRRYLGDF